MVTYITLVIAGAGGVPRDLSLKVAIDNSTQANMSACTTMIVGSSIQCVPVVLVR
jgi:hypothetical protein